MKKKNSIPYPFIGEELYRISPRIKPMFGCHAYYVGEKLMIILRDREDHPEVNGIWMASSKEHHESLRKEFPTMHSVWILSNGKNETEWQMIDKDDDNFETYALRICEMIIRKDERIGKIPKAKKKAGGRT